MKSLRQRSMLVLYSGSGLLGMMLAILPFRPGLADEFINISDIKECRAIKSNAERLHCYDTVSDGGIFNQQKLREVQVEEFGSNIETDKADTKAVVESGAKAKTETVTSKEKGVDISVDRIAVSVTRVQKDGTGRHYFQTTDGQVWKQQEPGRWTEKPPFEAEIKAGVMGSFYLMDKGGKSVRVKRVR